jgi:hypothetical protein
MSTDTETFTFEIIDDNATLKTWTDTSGRTRTTTGQIAILSTGQRMARSMVIDSDVATWAYGAADEFDRAELEPPGWKPAAFFQQKLDDTAARGGWHTLGASKEDREFAEFYSQFPAVAEFLKLPKNGATPGLFNAGRVRFEKGICKTEDELRALLTRHRQGDFGTHGAYSPDLTYDEWFTCGLLTVDKQNSAAVLSQAGAIRSRFRVNDVYAIDVLTILAGARTRTLMHPEGA